jgi:hypothetical protein
LEFSEVRYPARCNVSKNVKKRRTPLKIHRQFIAANYYTRLLTGRHGFYNDLTVTLTVTAADVGEQ